MVCHHSRGGCDGGGRSGKHSAGEELFLYPVECLVLVSSLTRLPTLLQRPTGRAYGFHPWAPEKRERVLQPCQVLWHGGLCRACQGQTVPPQAGRCGLTLGTEKTLNNAIWDTLINDVDSDMWETFHSELNTCLFEKC